MRSLGDLNLGFIKSTRSLPLSCELSLRKVQTALTNRNVPTPEEWLRSAQKNVKEFKTTESKNRNELRLKKEKNAKKNYEKKNSKKLKCKKIMDLNQKLYYTKC